MRTSLVALVLLGASLAGCLGQTATEEPVDNTLNTTDKKEPSFVNPDGRGVSAAANETNKTVVGKGGIEHLHDYWGGASEIAIIDRDIWLSDSVFCDNKDTSKFGCYILRPPVTDPPTLVFEGTGQMEITITAVQPWVQAIEMRYKNGANPDWGELLTLQPDTPLVIDVSAIMTDMPHATTSQWAWKFIGNKAVGPASAAAAGLQIPGDGRFESFVGQLPDFHVTIKVIKSAKVVDWPGHPDFYADKDFRVVLDRAARTSTVGITDSGLYGDDANIVRPDYLVSSGTGNLSVYINITNVKSPGDVKPNRYILEYTNATGRWFRTWGEELEPEKSYHISIPVHYTGWDSPYAPTSAWQFRVIALYGTTSLPTGGAIGFCPGCFPYEVDYHMTIIAYPDPQYLGEDALEK